MVKNLNNFIEDEKRTAVIVNAVRTPIGKIGGQFQNVECSALIAPLIKRFCSIDGFSKLDIDDVILGNAANSAGNIARFCALDAGLPYDVPGVTIDRQCGSGLEAISYAARSIQAGAGGVYLAGGVESSSTAYRRFTRSMESVPRARFSPDFIGDPDMGLAAENVAKKYHITRNAQDAFALQSQQRAARAQENGRFSSEIIPVETVNGMIDQDECVRKNTNLEALAALKPIFLENGSVTAGNACPVNDGASLVLILSKFKARELGFSEGLEFVSSAQRGVDPNYLGVGPVASTNRLMNSLDELELNEVDFIEFNEAFASQVLASLGELGIASERVNKDGGAIALGHPYGASGALLVSALFRQIIRYREGETGLAMMGIAGGLGLTAYFKKTIF